MIFGQEGPRDDFVETIKRFLLDSLARNDNSIDNLEIEAKFGLIVDRHSKERINFPVLNECIVNFESGTTSFVSDMPLELHKKFNKSLNSRFADRSLEWKYKHTKMVDYVMPNKLRISEDAMTGDLVHAQRKQKLNQLEIFEPNCAMDIRISVNSEISVPVETVRSEDIRHPAVIKRKKDRIAYEIGRGLLSIDLTQVTQNDGEGDKIKHELELEVKDVGRLMNSEEDLRMFIDSLRELCQLII